MLISCDPYIIKIKSKIFRALELVVFMLQINDQMVKPSIKMVPKIVANLNFTQNSSVANLPTHLFMHDILH